MLLVYMIFQLTVSIKFKATIFALERMRQTRVFSAVLPIQFQRGESLGTELACEQNFFMRVHVPIQRGFFVKFG